MSTYTTEADMLENVNTPGCEGGQWCRCEKRTPCYPTRHRDGANRETATA